MARHKLERQGSATSSRSLKRFPPGMTYEEITSSRKPLTVTNGQDVTQKKIDLNDDSPTESLEPIQEKDIKATGNDPYEKFDYKMGETIFLTSFCFH